MRGQVRRLERQASAGGEIFDDSQGIQVAASVDRLARGLLRAHEVRGAHDLPRVGDGAIVRIHVGDAEIGDERAARARS